MVHIRYAQVSFAGFGPSLDKNEKRRSDRRKVKLDPGQFDLLSQSNKDNEIYLIHTIHCNKRLNLATSQLYESFISKM